MLGKEERNSESSINLSLIIFMRIMKQKRHSFSHRPQRLLAYSMSSLTFRRRIDITSDGILQIPISEKSSIDKVKMKSPLSLFSSGLTMISYRKTEKQAYSSI
jgi:hypothetical protein